MKTYSKCNAVVRCLGGDEPVGARTLAPQEARAVTVHAQVPMSCLMHHLTGTAGLPTCPKYQSSCLMGLSTSLPSSYCLHCEQTHRFSHLIKKSWWSKWTTKPLHLHPRLAPSSLDAS